VHSIDTQCEFRHSLIPFVFDNTPRRKTHGL
jgi:hypothetical protein